MRYVAYGSNLHPLRLAERTPSAQLLGTRFLRHWSLEFHKKGKDNSAKCNASRSGSGLHVAIYDISANDKAQLDRIEGPGYRSGSLRVAEFGECFLYLAVESHIDDSLAPFDWYRELVLLGCRRLGFPDAYIARIAATAAGRDPDGLRSESMWKTIRCIRSQSVPG